MNTNEFLKKFYRQTLIGKGTGLESTIQDLRPMAVCADGFQISIQASQYHYCRLRRDGCIDYKRVELGFPSQAEEMIRDYAEDDDLTRTVYGYVPVELVDRVLQKHGGIAGYRNAGEETEETVWFNKN